MAAINKPGVYISETLTPNAPSVQNAGDSVAVFIGVTDRGGSTSGSAGSIISTASVVNNWADFSAQYSYGVVSPFDGSAIVASASSQAYNNTVGTTSLPLKYAVKTFFDNGGNQAIIVRDVKKTATQAVARFNDNQQNITQAGTWTLDYTSNTAANKLLVSSATAEFSNLEAGRVVSFTGVTSANYTFLNSTYSTTGTGTGGSATANSFSVATAGVYVGQSISGANVPAGATVSAVFASSTSTTAAGAYTAGANLTISSNSNISVGQVVSVTTGTGVVPTGTIVTAVVNATTIKLSNSTTTNFGAGDTLTFQAGVTASATLTGTVTSGSNNITFATVGTKRWVITDVANDGKSFCILYKNPLSSGAAIGSATQALSGSGIKLNNGTAAAVTALISAKDHGVWGNNIWVDITPNAVENTFDLNVYYTTDPSKNSASLITANERVETFPNLSMSNTDPRYAPNYINNNSDWITFADNASPATGYDDIPLFTTLWNVTTTTSPTSSTDYSFSWDANQTTTSLAAGSFTASASAVVAVGATQVNKVRVGSTVVTKSTAAGTAGLEGTGSELGAVGAFTATDILPRLDEFIQPLIINYPDAVNLGSSSVYAAAITKMLNYAANRADSFVIIDPYSGDTTPKESINNTLSLMSSNLNYGAAYFPNIKIADPTSPVPTATVSVPPGGAVAGEYVSTDATRGVFKAPAGIYSQIGVAKNVAYSMNTTDFDTVYNGRKALNIIRPIPGSGICVMGARTLSSLYADKYVPTRRSLNYIASNLKSLTQFAIFEPNDQNLWNNINAVVSGFLDSFWRAGGLLGASSDQAYFVKCDATTNTTTAVANGEVRIEVGVALQRPAEFIIIKLGQINGGATITTSS